MEKIKKSDTKYCRFLRAKSPYGNNEGGEYGWRFPDDSNTISWCIKSIGGAGPDNGLVGPSLCGPGRKCYQEPVE